VCVVQVGVPYIATWVFGDPHQAASGIIPELLSLQPEQDDDDDDDDVLEEEQQQLSDEFQGQPPIEGESFRSAQDNNTFQTASDGTSRQTDVHGDSSGLQQPQTAAAANKSSQQLQETPGTEHDQQQQQNLRGTTCRSAAVTHIRQSSAVSVWSKQIRRRLLCVAVRMLRWLLHVRQHGHMAAGLINIGYEVGYLLKMSPYFSPAHHIAGLVLVRDDGSRAVCCSLSPLCCCFVPRISNDQTLSIRTGLKYY
jgi:hypothetical protein